MIEKFPHIREYRAFKLPPGLDVKFLLKCQLAVAAFDCKLLVVFPSFFLNNVLLK